MEKQLKGKKRKRKNNQNEITEKINYDLAINIQLNHIKRRIEEKIMRVSQYYEELIINPNSKCIILPTYQEEMNLINQRLKKLGQDLKLIIYLIKINIESNKQVHIDGHVSYSNQEFDAYVQQKTYVRFSKYI